MAEKNRYPQIPSTVWWGVRSLLQRTPNVTVDERLLGVQLGVQDAAAKQYITELKSVGILTEEGKATPLAQKWRLDETYGEAVEKLIASIYPEGLVQAAERDRQRVVNWFLREGLGQGAAGNKAATYLLIGSPNPNEAPTRGGAQAGREASTSQPRRRRADTQKGETAPASAGAGRVSKPTGGAGGRSPSRTPVPDAFPLNVNVQIHISADAGSEQIESIFSAMKRYLYDAPGT
jgi:hypothetical protein